MRSRTPDTDDPLLGSLRGPDTDVSLAVSLGVTLAVAAGVLATTAPTAALVALALVAARAFPRRVTVSSTPSPRGV